MMPSLTIAADGPGEIADRRCAISDLRFFWDLRWFLEKITVGKQPRRGVTIVTPGGETEAPAKDSEPGVPKSSLQQGPS